MKVYASSETVKTSDSKKDAHDDQSDGDQLSETSDIEPMEDDDEACDDDMQVA